MTEEEYNQQRFLKILKAKELLRIDKSIFYFDEIFIIPQL